LKFLCAGQRSADPLVARQSLAVAQSLLREIELQPLPGSAVAAPTPGRTGFAAFTDYHGLTLNGITDAEGQALPGLEAFRAEVSISAQALAGVPQSDGWFIRVAVTGPDGVRTELASWRAKR
jgi:MSHA pilin protein MshD